MPSDSLPRLTKTRIKHYFNLARNACNYSDFTKVKMGAVLIYKGKILSIGWNSNKTSPLQQELNKFRNFEKDVSLTKNSIHAEVACIAKVKDLNIDWGRVSIFVYRIKKDGSPGYARPCEGCQTLIKSIGIKNIYYTTNDGWCFEKMK